MLTGRGLDSCAAPGCSLETLIMFPQGCSRYRRATAR